MKTQDFRLNNLVSINGDILESINKDGFGMTSNIITISGIDNIEILGYGESGGNSTIESAFDLEDLNPIPLINEWMTKFGFEKIAGNYEKDWFLLHRNMKTGTIDFLLNEPHTGKYKATTLRYVHQLQNLYFALTGEELTYE